MKKAWALTCPPVLCPCCQYSLKSHVAVWCLMMSCQSERARLELRVLHVTCYYIVLLKEQTDWWTDRTDTEGKCWHVIIRGGHKSTTCKYKSISKYWQKAVLNTGFANPDLDLHPPLVIIIVSISVSICYIYRQGPLWRTKEMHMDCEYCY